MTLRDAALDDGSLEGASVQGASMQVASGQVMPAVTQSPAAPQTMDEAAFQVFYQRTAPRLRSYIHRSAGSADLPPAFDMKISRLTQFYITFTNYLDTDSVKS